MSETRFSYVALDPVRGRVKGAITAFDEPSAFERVRALGLTPISLRPADPDRSRAFRASLSARDTAALVADLGALLKAGADIRSALRVIGGRKGANARAMVAAQLATDVSGGEALDVALLNRLGPRFAFVAALTAAGEASGNPGAGLERAALVLDRQLAVRDQLASALSYPLFVLATAMASFLVILLLVVPSIAPLAREVGGEDVGGALPVLLALSDLLRERGLLLVLGLLLAAGLVGTAAALGLLKGLLERMLLDGPVKGVTRGLVYGGFATDLGGILASGASMNEALRLAERAITLDRARQQLSGLGPAIREGERLSDALSSVSGLPDGISSLALIGEETGTLGPMLEKAGRLEEATALRRIEAIGRLVGPIMIVGLGGLVGLMMASLLSSVSSLGGAALG